MFNFFQKPFGLDIADTSIKLISLAGSFEKPKLLSLGKAALEPDIVEDGKILNKEKLKRSLSNLILNPEFGKIKKRECIFSLPESKVFLHFFKIPENLKKEERFQKIKFEAGQTFPYPLEELYYDFMIYPVRDYKGKEKRQREQISNGVYPEKEVLLAASPKNIVNDYLNVFKICQIEPIALEIESESLTRALIGKKEGVILIIDIGARTTNFSLFDGGQLKLSISIPIAGNKFTQKIAEKLKIPLSEAEGLKVKHGLNPEVKEGKIFLILQQEFREIIEEIEKIENYFQQKIEKKIGKIILTGGSAQLPFLPEYLAENLGVKVEIGDPWAKINIDILKKKEYLKEALKINPILYTTSIGSALRGLIKDPKMAGINLIKELKYIK